MMKRTLLATAILAGSSAAMAEFSGNVAVVTDYLFRGISQTDNDPAIQGGLDYNHASGFYAGIWGSNVDFLDGNDLELDYYAGFGGDLTQAVAFDVGVAYYDYPAGDLGAGSNEPEYWEIYGGLSGDVGPAALSGTIYYSPDYFGETGDGVYIDLGAEFEVTSGITLAAHIGHQSIDEGAASQQGFFSSEEDSYMDWSLGLSTSYGGVDFALTYSDTDLDSVDCFGTDICGDTVWFSVGKSL